MAASCTEDMMAAEAWQREAWLAQVAAAPDLVALRSALGALEAAVKLDCISPLFQRTPLLVKGAWLPVGELPLSAASPLCRTGPAMETCECQDCMLASAMGAVMTSLCLHGAGGEVASALPGTNNEVQQLPGKGGSPGSGAGEAGSGTALAWLPATAAALTLRLHSLAASLIYGIGQLPAREILSVSTALHLCSFSSARLRRMLLDDRIGCERHLLYG